MSWEVWGTPPDPEPNPCALCDEELGSSEGCKLCDEFNRANKAELELMTLRQTLRHRLRILKSRPIYEGAKKENGVSVELLQAMSLLFGVPDVLYPHEYEPAMVAEAEKAPLTFENGRHIYSDQPGCNCHYPDKPHPSIHADTCPYRIRFAAAWGLKLNDTPGVTASDEPQQWTTDMIAKMHKLASELPDLPLAPLAAGVTPTHARYEITPEMMTEAAQKVGFDPVPGRLTRLAGVLNAMLAAGVDSPDGAQR